MDYYTKVRDSLNFIEVNLEEKISLDSLAEKSYLSKYHYHRLFRRITGESVSRYITKKRMEKAAEELTQTRHPIIDVALKYQYASQESFSRAFSRIYGITPGKYRKLYTNRVINNVIRINAYFNNINMAA